MRAFLALAQKLKRRLIEFLLDLIIKKTILFMLTL